MIAKLCLCTMLVLGAISVEPASARIRPYAKNPRYWQYKGKPVLLLGGTDDDNLFQWTGKKLTGQLDLLASVGGNYVRCTMSSRDPRNVWPFAKKGRQYDLNRSGDEYWKRFETFLAETARRDIIVQIELWAFHDFNRAAWPANPWRPANAASYGTANTTLKDHYGNIERAPHDFFFTVPKLKNDSVVLGYQRKFVDRMLSCTLRYRHVLYCMTNEIPPLYSPEWGWYWCNYIKGKAAAAGKQVEATEMYWPPHLKAKQHHASLDRPGVFTYFEASQNSAVLEGQTNSDNLQFVWSYLAKVPRPINHVKIYGADRSPWKKVTGRHATECFWRNIIGGSASSRFHRPPHGLGLSKIAQAQIKSMRMLTESMDLFGCAPHNDLLSGLKKNGAYAIANPGREYAVYFPNGAPARLDLRAAKGHIKARWLDIDRSRWGREETLRGGVVATLSPPGKGHWAVLLVKEIAPPRGDRQAAAGT